MILPIYTTSCISCSVYMCCVYAVYVLRMCCVCAVYVLRMCCVSAAYVLRMCSVYAGICCVCAAYVLRCAGYVLQTCCICAAYVTYLFFSKANDVIMGAVSEGFTCPAHRDLHHGTS